MLIKLNYKLLRKVKLIIILLFAINFSVIPSVQSEAASKLKVHFIDVGQGDAILCQYGKSSVLIDSGTEKEYYKLKAYLKKAKISKISSVILTHPDSDHIGAADLVIEDYGVKKVYMTTYKSSSNEYKELLAAISENDVKRINVKKGSKISIGSLKANVLSADVKADNSNDSSIVTLLKFKKQQFLFTGDISASVENTISSQYDLSKVSVLKVAHHGSNYSSPINYLKVISPKISVISVGKSNSYGHPHKFVLRRLKKYSENIYRTDKVGTIVVTTNGSKKSLSVKKIKVATKNDADSGTTEQQTIEKNIIANKNSKVYHINTCSHLPNEKNRVYFNSSKNAEDEGYRPCSFCCE